MTLKADDGTPDPEIAVTPIQPEPLIYPEAVAEGIPPQTTQINAAYAAPNMQPAVAVIQPCDPNMTTSPYYANPSQSQYYSHPNEATQKNRQIACIVLAVIFISLVVGGFLLVRSRAPW